MFTWTSERRRPAAALALTMALAGCLDDGLALPGLPALFGPAEPPRQTTMADGALVLTAPAGYCIDRRRGAPATEGAEVVLLASCAGLGGGDGAPRPIWPALLSVSVIDGATAGDTNPAALTTFFESAAGRRLLAADGNPDSVGIVGTSLEDGVFIVHARDIDGAAMPGLGRDRWRAVFQRGGAMVAATVAPISGRRLPDDAGRALLGELVAAVRPAGGSVTQRPGAGG